MQPERLGQHRDLAERCLCDGVDSSVFSSLDFDIAVSICSAGIFIECHGLPVLITAKGGEVPMKNALIIEPVDDVVIAIEPIRQGEDVVFADHDGVERAFKAAGNIDIYHKIARKPISKGSKVNKYGEHIGEATRDIALGEHVHTHNVVGVREDLS